MCFGSNRRRKSSRKGLVLKTNFVRGENRTGDVAIRERGRKHPSPSTKRRLQKEDCDLTHCCTEVERRPRGVWALKTFVRLDQAPGCPVVLSRHLRRAWSAATPKYDGTASQISAKSVRDRRTTPRRGFAVRAELGTSVVPPSFAADRPRRSRVVKPGGTWRVAVDRDSPRLPSFVHAECRLACLVPPRRDVPSVL